jgi:hypothetical protein
MYSNVKFSSGVRRRSGVLGEYFQASVHIFNAAFPRQFPPQSLWLALGEEKARAIGPDRDLLADLADLGHLTLRFTADVFPRFSSISYSTC